MKIMKDRSLTKENITGNLGLLSNSFWLKIAGPPAPRESAFWTGEQDYLKTNQVDD